MSCCVNFCKNRSDGANREGLRFYRFPSEPKQRVLWLKAARRWDLLRLGPGPHRRICSTHFITGKYSLNPTHPDYVPSIFPFNREREYTRITQRVQRFIRHGKRAEAAGAPFTPLCSPAQPPGQLQVPSPGRPPGQLQGQPPEHLHVHPPKQLQDAQESGTVVLLIYNPPEGSKEQAVRMDYKIKVEETEQLEPRLRDHTYCRSPHSASVEPQPDQMETVECNKTQQTQEQHLEPEEPPQNQELCTRQEMGKKEETGKNETNVLSKETQKSETENSDSQNKQKEAQNIGEHPKPLLCPICGNYSWSVERFVSHVKKHGDELYRCKVCDKNLRSKSLLDMHMRIHTGETPFSCSYCDKRYRLKKSLQTHMRLHTSGFECSLCGMKFRGETFLQRHLIRHEEKAEREREQAGKSQSGGQGLQQETSPQSDISRRPSLSFQCSVCGKSFKKQCKLDDHMPVHTGERPHQCSVCPKRFATKTYLYVHTRVHTQEKRYSCSFCGRKFRTNCTLQAHLQAKHTGKTFECGDCGRKFPSNSKMKTHAKRHAQDRQRPYSCSVCLQVFEILQTAEEHLEIHKKERELKESSGQSIEHCDITVKYLGAQYLCSECGKTFYLKVNLDQHMRFVHTQERPFNCSICDLKFKWKVSLSQHMMLHTGEKPYSCSVCQKGFRHMLSLKTHMLIHTGAKPFACTICSARFRQRSALSQHAAVHIKERLFSCTVCPKKYKTINHLNDHMRATHAAGDHRCSFCRKRFMSEVGLHKHVTIKHIMPQNYEDETMRADAETKKAADGISQINIKQEKI